MKFSKYIYTCVFEFVFEIYVFFFFAFSFVEEKIRGLKYQSYNRQQKLEGFLSLPWIFYDGHCNYVVITSNLFDNVNLQVNAKRTNVPGMKQYRGRRFNPYMGYRFRRPYVPPYFYSPYGYG